MGALLVLASCTMMFSLLNAGIALWNLRTLLAFVRRATPGFTRKPVRPSNGIFPILPMPPSLQKMREAQANHETPSRSHE